MVRSCAYRVIRPGSTTRENTLTNCSPEPANRYLQTTRLFGLAVCAPLLLALALPVAVSIAQRPEPGFSVHRLEVVAVHAGGPAQRAGIQIGDRVISVNDTELVDMVVYHAATADLVAFEPIRYGIDRGGTRHVMTVLPHGPDQPTMIRNYCLWTIGLAFLSIGWWVQLRRNDPVARGFFGLCFVFAFFLLDIPDLPNLGYTWGKEVARLLAQSLMPAFFLRFFLMFPGRRPGSPAGGVRASRWLLLPGGVLFAVTLAVMLSNPGATGSDVETVLELATLVYMLSYFLAGLYFFGRRTVRRDRPIQRTKMLVVLAGLVVGLLPFLLGMMLAQAVPDRLAGPAQFLSLSLILVPSSFALAIMRYGALDRAFVVRAGLVYAILTLLVLMGYLLAVAVLGNVLSTIFRVSTQPVLLVVVAVSSLAILPLRRTVQDWVDDTFYPARRVHREKLTRLGTVLSELLETDEVVAALRSNLVRLFRPHHLFILLCEKPDGPLLPTLPPKDPADGTPHIDELDAQGDLAKLLVHRSRPLHNEEIGDMLLDGGCDPAALEWLERHDLQLLVPLVSGRRLVGLCAFGPKIGGALYSQEDLAGLRSVAMHAASVLENRRLHQDSLRRQRLETELEVARGIQSSLLPTTPLVTRELAISGHNVACRGVGGDYYDYFLREDGRLALTIADVAGKGIPAALLMTSLCTAFRREAEGRLEPAHIAVKLNAALGTRIAPGRFVCFFCAVWDPSNGMLRYCNAGMDPPVLFRPGAAWQHRLRKGGPVLGAVEDHAYREGALTLEPGDRLFLHTDGMTDQRNEEGEFYDEDRLFASVTANLDHPPARVLGEVFAGVQRFGSGGEGDDMTAMLLEIKDLKK